MAISRKTALTRKRFTLPAGGENTLNVTGNFVICTEAFGGFDLYLTENSDALPWNVGLSVRLQGDDFFDKLRFVNQSATLAVVVEVMVGIGDVIDSRLNIVRDRPTRLSLEVAKTVTKSSATVSIAGGAFVALAGTDTVGSGRTYRKCLLLTNNDPAVNLEIVGLAADMTTETGVVASAIYGTVTVIETSDNLKIKNNSGAAIACRICELFFIET